MATVPQYVTALEQRFVVIARRLGADLRVSDKQTRVVVRALLILIAVVIKTIVDNSTITNAMFDATLDSARDDPAWQDEPAQPPPLEL